MFSKITSGAVFGLDSIIVDVEVHVYKGNLPRFTIVGLPDKAVEEAKDRVCSAIKNSGFSMPGPRITVNLAPADLPKEGPAYDLPIALGLLIASGQIPVSSEKDFVIGELSLDGKLRPVTGVLPQMQLAKEKGITTVFLPAENAPEAAIISELTIFPVSTLKELIEHFTGAKLLSPYRSSPLDSVFQHPVQSEFDFAYIKGQEKAKRALEIAAAGGHNVLMSGPPGSGKTLLARTFPTILPELTVGEALEVTKIYSVSGLLPKEEGFIRIRPFRAPHHTTSNVGLVGGGVNPKPGEISLAHRGVLFLDEFPEFNRQVLEAMRQPLEDGYISVSRAKGTVLFPAKFMLIAARNPCPCGYFGSEIKSCTCASSSIIRYEKKISGPILDRIDLHLTVSEVPVDKLTTENNFQGTESSVKIRQRVQQARLRQEKRFVETPIYSNSEMTTKHIQEFCQMQKEGRDLLKQAVSQLGLSARSYFRVIKIAQTIADLNAESTITMTHLAEALQYRPLKED